VLRVLAALVCGGRRDGHGGFGDNGLQVGVAVKESLCSGAVRRQVRKQERSRKVAVGQPRGLNSLNAISSRQPSGAFLISFLRITYSRNRINAEQNFR